MGETQSTPLNNTYYQIQKSTPSTIHLGGKKIDAGVYQNLERGLCGLSLKEVPDPVRQVRLQIRKGLHEIRGLNGQCFGQISVSDNEWCLKELIVPLSLVAIFGRNGCVTLTSVDIRARGRKFKSLLVRCTLEGAFSKKERMMQGA